MKVQTIFALAVAMVPSVLNAQAFGVRMGAPVSEFSGHRAGAETGPYYFRITVPQPNREFESYSALATPETGICKVSGIGRTHENDSTGASVQSAFEDMKTALKERYGQSRDFDFLHAGAVWDKPSEWVWSIYKNERSLASFWDLEEGSKLPVGIAAISLVTKSVQPTSGAYLTLSYEFSNFARCQALVQRAESSGL